LYKRLIDCGYSLDHIIAIIDEDEIGWNSTIQSVLYKSFSRTNILKEYIEVAAHR